MLAINPEEVKGIDYFDEEISKNDAKQKIYKLNIGEFIIFKATISNEDIVLASENQQETDKIIKVQASHYAHEKFWPSCPQNLFASRDLY